MPPRLLAFGPGFLLSCRARLKDLINARVWPIVRRAASKRLLLTQAFLSPAGSLNSFHDSPSEPGNQGVSPSKANGFNGTYGRGGRTPRTFTGVQFGLTEHLPREQECYLREIARRQRILLGRCDSLRTAHQEEGIASFRFLEWSSVEIIPNLERAVRNQP